MRNQLRQGKRFMQKWLLLFLVKSFVLKVDQTELKEEYVQNNIPAETQLKVNDLNYLVDCMKD